MSGAWVLVKDNGWMALSDGNREAFEEEAKRYGLGLVRLSKRVGAYQAGDYADGRTNLAWYFWDKGAASRDG